MARHLDQEKVFTQLLVLSGNRSFPVDMLRYDNCIPHSEQDAHRIERSQHMTDGTFLVCVKRYAPSSTSRPTEGRWASFGWQITWTGMAFEMPDETRRLLETADALVTDEYVSRMGARR